MTVERIEPASLDSPAAQLLIARLNAELSAMYPEPGATHFALDPAQVSGSQGAFLVAIHDGTPVGCGAVRLIDPETAELKRMFVDPALRGTGLGRRLVAALEAAATERDARRVVLETGIRQLAALALYEKCGYSQIPLYGEYRDSAGTSICLGKSLAP